MTRIIRRGRPLGPLAQAVLSVVRSEPATVSMLAARLQLSYRAANVTVSRLQSAGYVTYGSAIPGQHDRPARLVQAAAPTSSPPEFDPFVVRWR